MLEKIGGFTKKKALLIVISAALVILLLIILRSCGASAPDMSTPEGRESYLLELGWEIDRASEQCRRVIVPETLEGVMLEYNKMQLSQGFDLREHLGESCSQYTYTVTNYPNCDETVLITLYIQGNELIAGDIHTTAINGFMHGIRRQPSE